MNNILIVLVFNSINFFIFYFFNIICNYRSLKKLNTTIKVINLNLKTIKIKIIMIDICIRYII